MNTSLRKEVLSIPNLLSCLRIVLIPVFILLYVRAQTYAQYCWALAVVVVSGLTDLLDGFIARKFHMVTRLGKALDPIADKLTQVAVAICLTLRYPWMLALVIMVVVNQLFMGINGVVLLRRGKMLNGAKMVGKITTAVFYLSMAVLIAVPTLPVWAVNAVIALNCLMLLVSMISYIPAFQKLYRSAPTSEHGREEI